MRTTTMMLTWRFSINVNDPTLIALVNKLQDVFTTVGVSTKRLCPANVIRKPNSSFQATSDLLPAGTKPDRFTTDCCGRVTVEW